MKSTALTSSVSIASAAPTIEPRQHIYTQWFGKVVAQPEVYKPNKLTFSFSLGFTDTTSYFCDTFYDTNTGVSANKTCTHWDGETIDATATVVFPGGQADIGNFAPYVYIPDIATTYTANVSTEDPQYTCGHTGTPGIPAKCFKEFGTFTATAV